VTRLDLSGANVLLTGASGGIGPHIARALASHGARLALVARSGPELEVVAAGLVADGAVAVAIVGDVTSSEERRRMVAAAESELGPLDALVNNAGGDTQREFHRLSESDIREVIELSLTSAVLLGRLVLPGMLERGTATS
jgi:short-subunit dehydrogenase